MTDDINLALGLDKKNDVNVDIYASAFSEETAAALKKMQAQLDELTTLATNNGLDILSHTQFLEEPTVEIVKDYNKLTGSNLITKQHLETKG